MLARARNQSEWPGSKNNSRLDSLWHRVPSKQFSPVPGQQETRRAFDGLVMQGAQGTRVDFSPRRPPYAGDGHRRAGLVDVSVNDTRP